jgi:hypothetical protein
MSSGAGDTDCAECAAAKSLWLSRASAAIVECDASALGASLGSRGGAAVGPLQMVSGRKAKSLRNLPASSGVGSW